MSSPPVQPVSLSLVNETTLQIEWSDLRRRLYSVAELRASCPCATCAIQRRQAPSEEDRPPEAAPPLAIRQMTPVGNYAYKIIFSDGHATGIFPLELLRTLGEETK